MAKRDARTAAILDLAYREALSHLDTPFIGPGPLLDRVTLISRDIRNRAGVRFLLAALLAVLEVPQRDIRKPYTEIGTSDSYSGRTLDETYVTPFVNQYRLPCNRTTAFLTPAFRNIGAVLTPEVDLVGRPRALYQALLTLLDDVYQKRVAANTLLREVIRQLIHYRDEREQRMEALKESLVAEDGGSVLSSEGVVTLIEQHLQFKKVGARGSSRLPVLVVAAAYTVASEFLGERVVPLESHNAADLQTGSLGDVEIVTLVSEDDVVTCYEMKTKLVTQEDIEIALQKIDETGKRPDNYIFITTVHIDRQVQEYAVGLYAELGVEFVILDCVGFIRHFLHLFHRLRHSFLDEYQRFLLAEPDSSVSQPLKEAFLAIRHAAESGE